MYDCTFLRGTRVRQDGYSDHVDGCESRMSAPPAAGAPLLEPAGPGRLRIRFAAPPSAPPCAVAAIWVRAVGAAAWSQLDSLSRTLVADGGKTVFFSSAEGKIVVEVSLRE